MRIVIFLVCISAIFYTGCQHCTPENVNAKALPDTLPFDEEIAPTRPRIFDIDKRAFPETLAAIDVVPPPLIRKIIENRTHVAIFDLVNFQAVLYSEGLILKKEGMISHKLNGVEDWSAGISEQRQSINGDTLYQTAIIQITDTIDRVQFEIVLNITIQRGHLDNNAYQPIKMAKIRWLSCTEKTID